VAGWLLVQIATQVFPFFEVPNSAVRWTVLVIVAGFPVALVLAWLFDLTPQGIVRTPDANADAPGDAPARQAQHRSIDRRLNYLLGLMLIPALALLAYDRLRPGGGDPMDPSIAVLPLLDESGDSSTDYFSEGLSEELIAALAQVRELKVIGRSSSFRFKGSSEDRRSIGEKLGVATLLEGTVRRQGAHVRIVAELVHAADGRELWSHTYDATLQDIFTVQAQIAAAVAESLKLTLLGGGTSGAVTRNMGAHNAYLQAHFLVQRLNVDDYLAAMAHYDEAIRLDPDYALAYAERSEVQTWLLDWRGDPGGKLHAGALADAEKAVALAPDLAEAHAALGWVRFFIYWQFDAGLGAMERAAQLAPNNATVNELLGRVLLYMGRFGDAERVARRSIEIDPLTFQAHENLARILFVQGRIDEAETEGRKAAELQPKAAGNHRWQALAAHTRRDAAAALREARLESSEGYRDFELALVQTLGQDQAAADAALAELIRFGHQGLAYQIAEVYAQRGQTEAAFQWLQRAWDQHDNGLLSLAIDPLLRPLHDDARYTALRSQLGLPAPST
jgi:serine/threonine-protein kinase